MVDKKGRGRPKKTAQEKLNNAVKAAKNKADKIQGVVPTEMNQWMRSEDVHLTLDGQRVNLDYVALRLKDIKNMDEVNEFYRECVFNLGINYLNGVKKYE